MRRMFLLIGCWLVAMAPCAASAPELIAGVFDPPRAAPELGLEGSHGRTLNLADYRGKVVILGFGFTSCSDVCPVTLAILAQARKQLGDLADELQVVYVTVDPETDTAARMGEYLALFDPTFVGGTGSEEALKAVRKEYGIVANRQAKDGSGYTYAHSSYAFLIDRQGLVRALMPYGHPAEDFVHDARALLAEPR